MTNRYTYYSPFVHFLLKYLTVQRYDSRSLADTKMNLIDTAAAYSGWDARTLLQFVTLHSF